jgi:lipopolysaccharide transport system permease protein
MSGEQDSNWEISNRTSYWGLSFIELWKYKHLIASLVRQDFLLSYQQTILGPVWILFQPLLTLATYVLVFGKLIQLSTGSLPPILFYFSGIVMWNLFSDCLSGTSNTFNQHSHIFSKVYFPRIIMPIAAICTHFLRLSIQLVLLFLLTGYFWFYHGLSIQISLWLLTIPFILLFISLIGFGAGLIFSILTAKYRDLNNLIAICLRLLMFGTPVIYSLAKIPERARWVVQINPLTPLFEAFRIVLFGEGSINKMFILYSFIFTLAIVLIGLVTFNKQGDKLIDVI